MFGVASETLGGYGKYEIGLHIMLLENFTILATLSFHTST